jgi:hypothetical protein
MRRGFTSRAGTDITVLGAPRSCCTKSWVSRPAKRPPLDPWRRLLPQLADDGDVAVTRG